VSQRAASRYQYLPTQIEEATGTKVLAPNCAHMYSQHLLEESRVMSKGAQRAAPDQSARVQQQHAPRHKLGQAADFAMRSGVGAEIARSQGGSQRQRLAKSHRQSFPGDGVDRTRGFADQYHSAAPNLIETS